MLNQGVTMVTLDENLALNRIQAHLGDNVEIRCDITGEPQKPAIKWFRHGVDLSTLNLPYIKVERALACLPLSLTFALQFRSSVTDRCTSPTCSCHSRATIPAKR